MRQCIGGPLDGEWREDRLGSYRYVSPVPRGRMGLVVEWSQADEERDAIYYEPYREAGLRFWIVRGMTSAERTQAIQWVLLHEAAGLWEYHCYDRERASHG